MKADQRRKLEAAGWRVGDAKDFLEVTIPPDLKDAYGQLQGHVLELHGRWNLFLELYRGNEESHPVLAATGSELFWLLGRLLHRGVFQMFRQLTDPPRSVGRANASLRGLLGAIGGPSAETEHADVVALLPEPDVSSIIRAHANKYVSHLDLDLLAGRVEPPAAVEIEQMESALTAIDTFMNEVGRRFLGATPVPYRERAELITSQAERLVHLLRAGLIHDFPV